MAGLTQYELIIGTDITDDEPNAESLAVAQAVNSIREGWIAEIHGADVCGSGDAQYGVRVELSSYEPASMFEQYAETVEVV